MTTVLVERVFEDPVEFEAIQELEDRGAWCLQKHGVRFVRTWFSRDRRRMVCLYEAPDAESVRIAQSKAGMPVARVWPAARVEPLPGTGPTRQGTTPIVVERTFEQPWTLDSIDAGIAMAGACHDRHGVQYLGGFLSHDGRRMICVFLAADAESVRLSNRAAGAPFDCAWPATLHEPQA